jgi:hypothetical protein
MPAVVAGEADAAISSVNRKAHACCLGSFLLFRDFGIIAFWRVCAGVHHSQGGNSQSGIEIFDRSHILLFNG